MDSVARDPADTSFLGALVVEFGLVDAVLVRDPTGQRLGTDTATGRNYFESPGMLDNDVLCSEDEDGGCTQPHMTLQQSEALPGWREYFLTVSPGRAFRLDARAEYNGGGALEAHILEATWRGPRSHIGFLVGLPAQRSQGPIAVTGLFAGTTPDMIGTDNDLVRFASPLAAKTMLVPGVDSFTAILFLAPDLPWSDLSVTWNGAPVPIDTTHREQPRTLVLAPRPGANLLAVNARVIRDGETLVDSDSLAFQRPEAPR